MCESGRSMSPTRHHLFFTHALSYTIFRVWCTWARVQLVCKVFVHMKYIECKCLGLFWDLSKVLWHTDHRHIRCQSKIKKILNLVMCTINITKFYIHYSNVSPVCLYVFVCFIVVTCYFVVNENWATMKKKRNAGFC